MRADSRLFKMFLSQSQFYHAQRCGYIADEIDDDGVPRHILNFTDLPRAEVLIQQPIPTHTWNRLSVHEMEVHHPDLMRYAPRTRRIINAYMSGGWDAVDEMERYAPDIEVLIATVNLQHEAQEGKDRLWGWFGLSRAAWLTLPRVLMHAMPDKWQKAMAILLEQFDNEFPGVPSISTRVNAVSPDGKFLKMPDWLGYRHPDMDTINAFKCDNRIK